MSCHSLDSPRVIFRLLPPAATHPEDDVLAEDLDQPYILDSLVLDPVPDITPAPSLTVTDLNHHYEQIRQEFFLPVMAQIEH
ncbi:hypothetical protein F0562_022365 [Nyssa sinensis]|uniref:Uncharacterized protein n=1 Tax=Nyssa sinensis TaxID=561372 RepID=A0A5J5BRL8_9ASTE|nr:hypothetical protein F0562_022365 [Nyssa sinensis]